MVIISEDIQIQLKSLVEQYVDYRTKGEYGISAFWYWYYQVMNYLRCMDNAKTRSGFNKVYRMPKWGTVVYSKIVIGKEVIVYADTFKYSKRNLYDWLNHKSNRRPSYSVCDTCFGFSSVLYDNSHKYGILKPDGKSLVKPIFDDIINFHHSSNDYKTLHAIGFINDRVYEITTDGNVILLHMSKDDYLNAIHKFFEAKQRCKIIEYKQYNTMKNIRNKVRLTESQLHNVIKESVKKILSEVFLSPSDDEMSHLNMDKNTYVHDSYDTIADSDGPLHMDDISSSEKSNVSITILKPFKYNQGSGSGSYDTSSSGEEVIILPNQTIELSAHNEKNWGAIHTWYQGMAKCAHRHTFYAHGRDSEYNRGVGNTKLIMRGYSTLINGEKKGFFRINQ